MMASRRGAFGILMGAAVGTLLLVPVQGSAQDSLSVSCAHIDLSSPVGDVVVCAFREEAFAQHILGQWYDTGDYDLAEDDAEAVRWYRRAAEQGFAPAQRRLGAMYAAGLGVPEGDVEAIRWYRRAAEQGEGEAQMLLGPKLSDSAGGKKTPFGLSYWCQIS